MPDLDPLADLLTVPPDARRALRVEGVGKRYPAGPRVLDGLTHTFAAGTATALVGPNGAGKSTLLRILAAQSRPTDGRVVWGDDPPLDVHEHPHRWLAHVGVVHDEPDLPPELSAEETLEWVARARGLWDADAPARHAALLDAVRLDERRARPVGTYSAGMLRSAQIAAALAVRPAVLLLDEPFRALDVDAVEAAVALVARARDGGATVVLSSHRADLLARLADDTLRLGGLRPA